MQQPDQKTVDLPSEEQVKNLLAFSRDQRLHASLSTFFDNPDEVAKAKADPVSWLSGRGIVVPPGVGVAFLDEPRIPPKTLHIEPPNPFPEPWEHMLWEIRMTDCHKKWVRETRGGRVAKYYLETVCYGWELTYNPPNPHA